jgi:hypothetical protein
MQKYRILSTMKTDLCRVQNWMYRWK